jgi:hypothetical protein
MAKTLYAALASSHAATAIDTSDIDLSRTVVTSVTVRPIEPSRRAAVAAADRDRSRAR